MEGPTSKKTKEPTKTANHKGTSRSQTPRKWDPSRDFRGGHHPSQYYSSPKAIFLEARIKFDLVVGSWLLLQSWLITFRPDGWSSFHQQAPNKSGMNLLGFYI